MRGPTETVLEQWIDYNGHMNVGFYTMAFDRTIDFFLENELGIGPSYVKLEKQGPYSLQANYHYLKELKLEETFYSKIFLLDFDSKRMHLVLEMVESTFEKKVAVCETLLMNVNLILRKSTPYPDWVLDRLDAYRLKCVNTLVPQEVGKPICVRKKK